MRVEDVAYGAAPLLARLYIPDGPGPFPAVVSVHGGRWCAETRLSNAVIDTALAEAGVFVMAIDFRMPPAVQYPEPVSDIHQAICWLKRAAGDWAIDPARIGGIGTSSGGHQLLLNALMPGDARYAAHGLAADAALAFVVACWPPSDPVARYRWALARGMQVHIDSHHAYWPDEAAMAEGSPQAIVEAGRFTHLPPLLLVQGAADEILTPDMAQRFAAAWAAAGGSVRLEVHAGQGHTFITKAPESPAAALALRQILGFIAAQG